MFECITRVASQISKRSDSWDDGLKCMKIGARICMRIVHLRAFYSAWSNLTSNLSRLYGVLFVATVLIAVIAVTANSDTPVSNCTRDNISNKFLDSKGALFKDFTVGTCTLNFFWFLSWTLLQGSEGTPSSSMEGLMREVLTNLLRSSRNDHRSPLPVLQSLPPNLRQGGFPPSQDKSARHGGQHVQSLEVKQFWCKNLPNLVYQKLKMQFAFFFLHISRKLCGRLRLQFNRSINMVGFSTGPQKETQLRRPGCIHGVKQMEIKWESCLIINHENGVLKLHRRETWTIAARNRRRSYSITGVFWGAAFTFRRRRRPLLPLRLPQLYPTSIRSGCLAIAEGYNHSITLKTKSVSAKFTCMMSVLSL